MVQYRGKQRCQVTFDPIVVTSLADDLMWGPHSLETCSLLQSGAFCHFELRTTALKVTFSLTQEGRGCSSNNCRTSEAWPSHFHYLLGTYERGCSFSKCL